MSDTIAAISSGLTNSGIGIIRISGSNAVSIADSIFVPKGKKLSESKSHTIHYGRIMSYSEGEMIDEVLVLLMKAPNTYTCEDVVEIDCHGGITVLKKTYETVLNAGARPAEPGEFTKRAFLNGRIDLSQAESVMGIIASESEATLSASLSNLNGRLSDAVKRLRERILYENAFIESALDDPEHYSLEGYTKKLQETVDEIIDELCKLIKSYNDGELLRNGIKTVIVGKPNAGKSSVWNMLIGKERAIVTDIAGTTRDALEETVSFGDFTLRLIDTAGIRNTTDTIEKIGVEKTMSSIDEADLVLYVVDSSLPLDDNDENIMKMISDKPTAIIYNKTDLEPIITTNDIKQKINKSVIEFSTKTSVGYDELKSEISDMFFGGQLGFNEQIYISNLRQKNEIMFALESMKNVKAGIENGMSEDFYSIDLTDAYVHLGYIIGENIEDDLIDKIFSEFCMGK